MINHHNINRLGGPATVKGHGIVKGLLEARGAAKGLLQAGEVLKGMCVARQSPHKSNVYLLVTMCRINEGLLISITRITPSPVRFPRSAMYSLFVTHSTAIPLRAGHKCDIIKVKDSIRIT